MHLRGYVREDHCLRRWPLYHKAIIFFLSLLSYLLSYSFPDWSWCRPLEPHRINFHLLLDNYSLYQIAQILATSLASPSGFHQEKQFFHQMT